MNALIIGGYGYIGSAIAMNFIKENNQVTIWDDLSSGSKDNVSLLHDSITKPILSDKGLESFEYQKFDTIVFAVGNSSIIDEEYSVNYLKGLEKILKKSTETNVTQFIYLSSYHVYQLNNEHISEKNPLNEKSLFYKAEKLCNQYKGSGLSMSILRLSEVYGRGMRSNEGLISQIAWNHLELFKNIYKGSGSDFGDYIHSKDIGRAVYLTSDQRVFEVMNVSTDCKVLNEDIVTTANKYFKKNKEQYQEIKFVTSPAESCTLDNKMAKILLNWEPKQNFQKSFIDVIIKTSQFMTLGGSKDDITSPATVDSKGKSNHMSTRSLIEMLVLFTGFVILSNFMIKSFNLNSDIMIVFVLLIGLFYSFEISIVSLLLACIYTWGIHSMWGTNFGYELISADFPVMLISFIVAGPFVALIRNRSLVEKENMDDEHQELQSELTRVENAYYQSVFIKDQLRLELEQYGDSFGKVLNISNRLRMVEKEELFSEAVKIIAGFMEANSVAIYYFDSKKQYGRLAAYFGESHGYHKSIELDQYEYLNRVIHNREVYINYNFDERFPMVAAPITSENEIEAIVLIDEIEFGNLSIHYINKLNVLNQLISNALVTAKTYEESLEKDKYYADTIVLKEEWFDNMIRRKEKHQEDRVSDTFIIKLDISLEEGIRNNDQFVNLIRENDYIGLMNDGKIGVLFNGASISDREIVEKRFTQEGISVLEVI